MEEGQRARARRTHGQAHCKDKDKGQGHNGHAQEVKELPAPQAQEVQALRAVSKVANQGRGQGVTELPCQEHCAHLRAREALCAHSADLAEGKAAFAEKRAPRFEGR